MNDEEKYILQVIAHNGAMTTKQVSDLTGIRQIRMLRILKSMERYGIIRKESTVQDNGRGRAMFLWRV